MYQKRSVAEQELLALDFPELVELELLIKKLERQGRVNLETVIADKSRQLSLPIYSLEFGNFQSDAPVLILIGGVHGLERIASRVIIEYLKSFRELMSWDVLTQQLLERCRVAFYPIVNPVGFLHKTRSNGAGVDLMRNAPVDSKEVSIFNLVGGHRLSPQLPWYRGSRGDDMQAEAKALADFVARQYATSPFVLSVDFHSGFGHVDRLWFPYASSRKEFPNLVEVFALKRKIDQALPNHVYKIEPQANCYLTHGDMWDHLYLLHQKNHPQQIYIPLTLELGSWSWVKKNPRQIFNSLGIFNPMQPHRTKRILRRHMPLMDLLTRATCSYLNWARPQEEKRKFYELKANKIWYNKGT